METPSLVNRIKRLWYLSGIDDVRSAEIINYIAEGVVNHAIENYKKQQATLVSNTPQPSTLEEPINHMAKIVDFGRNPLPHDNVEIHVENSSS